MAKWRSVIIGKLTGSTTCVLLLIFLNTLCFEVYTVGITDARNKNSVFDSGRVSRVTDLHANFEKQRGW